MRESDFAAEIMHSFKQQFKNCHYNNIPDSIYNPAGRFNPTKKYDAYCFYKKKFIALEYKLHKTQQAFDFNHVTVLQLNDLQEVIDNGGTAYVVLGIRYKNIRKAFFISVSEYIFTKNYCISQNRKSIPLILFDKYLQAEWIGKGIWKIPNI